MPTSVKIFYVTAVSMDEAEQIARSLVEKKLCACVDILGEISSIYNWKGKVQNEREVAFLVKTMDTKSKALLAEIKRLHSHEIPCIISLDSGEGYLPYLGWIKESLD